MIRMNSRIALALTFSTFAPAAWPCECSDWQPLCARMPADTAKAKDMTVFVGTVATVEPQQPPSPFIAKRIRFEIHERLAGPEPSPTDVTTSYSGHGGCGIPFQPGERYLVVAHLNKGVWSTDTCSGTTTAATASRSLAFLRAKLRGEPIAPSLHGLVFAYTRKDVRSIPDPDLEIRLRDLRTGEVQQTRTGPHGRFFFDNLKPRRYEVDLPPGSGWTGIVEEAPLKWPVDLTKAACAGVTLDLAK